MGPRWRAGRENRRVPARQSPFRRVAKQAVGERPSFGAVVDPARPSAPLEAIECPTSSCIWTVEEHSDRRHAELVPLHRCRREEICVARAPADRAVPRAVSGFPVVLDHLRPHAVGEHGHVLLYVQRVSLRRARDARRDLLVGGLTKQESRKLVAAWSSAPPGSSSPLRAFPPAQPGRTSRSSGPARQSRRIGPRTRSTTLSISSRRAASAPVHVVEHHDEGPLPPPVVRAGDAAPRKSSRRRHRIRPPGDPPGARRPRLRRTWHGAARGVPPQPPPDRGRQCRRSRIEGR